MGSLTKMDQATLRPIHKSGHEAVFATSPSIWLRPNKGLGAEGGRRFTAADKHGLQLSSQIDPGVQDFWLAWWEKPASLAVNETIFKSGAVSNGSDGFWLMRGAAGTNLRVLLNDSVQATRVDETKNSVFVSGEWHMYLVTFDRDGNATIYRDVAAIATVDISDHQATLGSAIANTLGCYSAGTFGINSTMSRVLYGAGTLPTATEIAELYNQGNGKFYAELSAELQAKVTHAWNLNEGTNDSVAYDAKGTNDASVLAAELITDGGFEAITYGSELLTNGGFETYTHGYRTFIKNDKAFFELSDYPTAPGTGDAFFSVLIKQTAQVGAAYAVRFGGSGNTHPGLGLHIMDEGAGFKIRGVFSDGTASVAGTYSSELTLNTWYHVIVSCDRDGNMAVYINNGTPIENDISGSSGNIATLHGKAIGAFSTGTDLYWSGQMSHLFYGVGTLPDSTARGDLYNSGNGANYSQLASATQALIDHAWDMNESTATADIVDCVGGLDGTVTTAEMLSNTTFATRTGRTWAKFVATDKTWLSCADDAAHDFGTDDIFITASVKRSSTSNWQVILAKYPNSGGLWNLAFGPTGVISFAASDSGGTIRANMVTNNTFTSTSTNYHIAVLVDRSDHTNNKIFVNGVDQTLATNTGASSDSYSFDNSGKFAIGAYDDANATQLHFDGYIAQVGIGKPADASAAAVVTAAGTTLYNSGLGKYYTEIASADRTTLGLTAYYDLTQRQYNSSTDAVDATGSNDLTFEAAELVTNGTFATNDTTGWTNDPTYPWDTADASTGACQLANDGDGTPAYSSFWQAIAFTGGNQYSVAYAANKTSGELQVGVMNGRLGSARGYNVSHSSTVAVDTTFTAVSGAAVLEYWMQNNAAADWTIDNISVKATTLYSVSDADVFGSWVESTASGESHVSVESETAYGGSGLALRLDVNSADGGTYVQQAVLTVGNAYQVTGYAKSTDNATCQVGLGTGTTLAIGDPGSSWAAFDKTGTCASTTSLILARTNAASKSVFFDSVSLKATGIKATADNFGTWGETRGAGTCVIEGTIVNAGLAAAKVIRNEATWYLPQVEQVFSVQAGQRYRLSFSTCVDSGDQPPRFAVYDVTNSAYIIGDGGISTGITGTTYESYTCEFEAPAGCSQVRVYLVPGTTVGDVAYFDDVSVKQMSFTSWTTYEQGDSIVAVDDDAYAGSYCCRLHCDSGSEVHIHQNTLTSGNEYTATGYVKGDAPNIVKLYSGAQLGAAITLTGTYAAFTRTFTAGGIYCYFARAGVGDYESYWDNISIKSTGPAPCAGPREATLSDTVGGYHGVLTNMDTINCWSTDTPDGSYPAVLQDSVGSYDGTMVGFSDVDAARVDTPEGTWGVHVEDDGSGGYTGVLSPLANSRSSDVHPTSPRDYAFRCNGSTSQCVFDDKIVGTGDVTFCCRFKAAGWGAGGYGRIASNGTFSVLVASAYIYVTSDGSATATSGPSTVALNTYYTLTVTRTSAGVTNFYLNGSLSGTANQSSGPPTVGVDNWYIGNRPAGDRTFDGLIDDVRIFNSILSAADIAAYHAGSETSVTPVFRPRFDVRRRLPYLDGCRAIRYDGVDDYATLDVNPLANSEDATVMCWFKKRAYVLYQGLVNIWYASGAERAFILGYETPAGTFSAWFGDGTNAGTATIAGIETDEWMHVAATLDGSTGQITMYLNGVAGTPAATSVTKVSNNNGNASFNGIGRYTSYEWNGDIADVRLYTQCMSAADILAYVKGTNYTTGLVARWAGDDAARSIASCADGYSVEFDGTDDLAKLPALSVTGDWSVVFWMKSSQAIDHNYIFTCSAPIFIGRYGSGQEIEFYAGNSWNTGSSHVFNGAWHHIALTRVGTAYNLYVDGSPESGSPFTDTSRDIAFSANNGAFGGRYEATPSYHHTGKLDDLRIYSSALSAADVALLAAGNEPSATPVAHWTCNDGPQLGEPSDGDPIPSWQDVDNRKLFNQTTATYRPLYITNAINSRPALEFDTTTWLELQEALLAGASEYTIITVAKADASADMAIFGTSDKSESDDYFAVMQDADYATRISFNDGTHDLLVGDTVDDTNTHIRIFMSNGTNATMRLDNAAESITIESGANDGNGIGNVVGAESTTIGGVIISDALANGWSGYIADVIVWNRVLSNTELLYVCKSLAAWYNVSI